VPLPIMSGALCALIIMAGIVIKVCRGVWKGRSLGRYTWPSALVGYGLDCRAHAPLTVPAPPPSPDRRRTLSRPGSVKGCPKGRR
jgi:hypothetical protein